MFGDNPIRPPEKGDGQSLQVQEIFSTLQGEGPFTGHPAVFIRLGGCNLACSFCDTEFESYQEWALADIIKEVEKLAHDTFCSPLAGERVKRRRSLKLSGGGALPLDSAAGAGALASSAPPQGGSNSARNLIVLTGGEPLRQPIAPLCQVLLDEAYTVQIETNGTLWRDDIPEAVHIVCSPKNNEGRGYAPLRPDVMGRTQALKFIISASREGYGDVGEVGQAESGTPVYVQPMDEYDEAKNAANLKHAVALAQQCGYRLSLQVHKLLGLP